MMGVTKPDMDPKWLKRELEIPPRSQSDLARFLGLHHSKVNRMCAGTRAIKAWEADKIREYLAQAAPEAHTATGASGPATLTRIAQARHPTSFLPVRGTVEAGSWREPVLTDLDYENDTVIAPRWVVDSGAFALRVAGPSMNLLYPDGSYVVVRPWHGGPLPFGQRVIVERSRDGLIETTVKDLVRGVGGEPELWPRSNHPAHQTPVPYRDDDTTLRILGTVIWFMGPG